MGCNNIFGPPKKWTPNPLFLEILWTPYKIYYYTICVHSKGGPEISDKIIDPPTVYLAVKVNSFS